MLQSVRDKMKGTFVAGVVFLLFIVPLVLTGVGDGSFLGSAAGNDAASVDGKKISNAELRRAVYMRKQRLLGQQGVDPSADYLRDENLRGPVLENLTRRAALLVSAKEGGMGVSNATIDRQILDQPEFQVDGKFDSQTYRRLLSNVSFTPATYKVAISEDMLLGQHGQGINLSAFSTPEETNNLVSLIQQKRSFFTIKIPKSSVEGNVTITDEETAQFYEETKESYVDPEKMSVEYVQISVADIALTLEASPEDVREEYEAEVANFKSKDAFEIAHLLIEENDAQADTAAEVSTKLAAGEDFSTLVTQYSDDSGSKDSGGNLGVLTPGVFPEEFEQAVYALEEGQVSEPVTTDAGIHFIKVLSKTIEETPTFEERKAAIEQSLKLDEAESIYAQNLEVLEESLNAVDLTGVAQQLGIEVKTTAAFTRDAGTGVASDKRVRDAAFSEEVLESGYNSGAIELSNAQAIVVRKSVHTPERVKAFDEVKGAVEFALKKKKTDDALSEISTSIIAKLTAGGAPNEVAEEDKYEYKSFDKVKRTSADADFQVLGKAFSMALGGESRSLDTLTAGEGDHVIVGLTDVVAGTPEDMQEQQLAGLLAQLTVQGAGFEASSYEAQVISDADIDIF